MKLELVNISCGYSGKTVLNDVNFSLETGEICCILGPNGVGKTTLFKTILQLIKPLGGQVLLDGEDIARWPASKLAEKMAYVAQYHVPPFPYFVKDVIMLGRINRISYFGKPGARDREVVGRVAEEMGITHLMDRYYTEISGGERQLVMIARALVQEPAFLVLDEPTASLDYGNSLNVIKTIRRLREKGYGIVMTTHNPDHAFLCDSKAVLIRRDAPVLAGPVETVVTDENLISTYRQPLRVVQLQVSTGQIIRICVPVLVLENCEAIIERI